jgi:hypothetical protein
LIRPYCVATEKGERTTADPSLLYAWFRMAASGDAILLDRINMSDMFRCSLTLTMLTCTEPALPVS